MSAYYSHVTKAEKTGEREVTFTFDGPGNRELPQIVGQLNVLPKHWWEGTDKAGNKRDVAATTLEPPLGCGAYRIKEFVPGRTIVYERVKDYWGKDLNVNIGRDNFDELRFEYFRDATVALEAFKADAIDWRTENSAKNWATAYDFPAVKDKRVVLEEFPIRSSGGMQAFAFNIRRAEVQGPARAPRLQLRVRFRGDEQADVLRPVQAHRKLFRGHRSLRRADCRRARELEILETVRDKVPPEVFTTAYTNPVSGSPEAVRANLREATRLLREAGYEVRDQQAGQRQDRRAVHGRIPDRPAGVRAPRAVLQAAARAARHPDVAAHRRRRAIREPAAAVGLRHHRRKLGPIAVARQRAARLSGARRPPTSRARAIWSASRIRRSMR